MPYGNTELKQHTEDLPEGVSSKQELVGQVRGNISYGLGPLTPEEIIEILADEIREDFGQHEEITDELVGKKLELDLFQSLTEKVEKEVNLLEEALNEDELEEVQKKFEMFETEWNYTNA